jgi:hypothetical protein
MNAAYAQDAGRKEADFIVRNFRFQNGEMLPELRLHHVTLGRPKRDATGRVVRGGNTLFDHLVGASMANDQKGKQPFKRHRRNDAQIDRCNCMGVIAKKRLPALGWRRPPRTMYLDTVD